MANKGSFWKLSMACLLLLMSAFAVNVAEVSGQFGPNGSLSAAAESTHSRCGPTAGFGTVKNQKADEQTISELGEYQVVQCEKHLREHSTKLLHARVAGVKVAYPVFANSKDVPQSSALFDVSESSKQSSDSSPAKSSASSDSAEPVPVAVGFVVELSPAAATRRRHRALLQAATGVTVVSTVPTAEDVSTVNSWLGEFADQNQDLLLDGRDSITAGGFRKLSNGVILFTVYAVTTSSDLLVARVVELSEVASLNPGTSSARLFTPSDCVLSTEADVGFGTEEDLAAQLSAAPVSGCPSAQDIIVATPAATAPPAQPLAPTTTPVATTTPEGTTTTTVATTTPEVTTTAPVTTTADPCSVKESLIQFGNALSPPPSNWNSTTDLCDFDGLTCNATTDAVIALNFAFANYPGTLQPELSCVTDLQTLQLGGNTLTGTLPPEWSTLTNLKLMRLDRNSLSGTLPPQWSEFQNIEKLRLGLNDLTGALPAEWSALASITELQLRNNYFNKTSLPDQWAELADTLTDEKLTLMGNAPLIYDSDVPAAWKTDAMADKWKVDTIDD